MAGKDNSGWEPSVSESGYQLGESYYKYIQYLSDIEHSHPAISILKNFLQDTSNTYFGTDSTTTKIYYSKDGALKLSSENTDDIWMPRPDVSTRIIFVSSYKDKINRDLLACLAYNFELDPLCLASLFLEPRIVKLIISSVDLEFKSQKSFFLLRPTWDGETFAVFKGGEKDRRDVIIFRVFGGMAHFRLPVTKTILPRYPTPSTNKDSRPIIKTYDLFDTVFESLDRQQIQNADRNPLHYICFCLSPVALYQLQYAEQEIEWVCDQKTLDTFRYLTDKISLTSLNIKQAIEIISYCESELSDRSSGSYILLNRLNHIYDRLQILNESVRDHISICAGTTSIQEYRKSIELADSVRFLSQLAFVFLPLSLSSSIFGMNIREMGSGETSVWLFVLLTSIVLGLSFLALWIGNGEHRLLYRRLRRWFARLMNYDM